jgi:DNA replication protein DnaD
MPDFTENEKEYVNLVNELFRGCLSEKQLLVVKGWCAGGVPLVDVIEAHERTLLKIGDRGGAGFSYMSKIIERWQEEKRGNGILERAQRIDEKLQGDSQKNGRKKKATREIKPFTEKEIGYISLLEEIFNRKMGIAEVHQIRHWVEVEVPLTEIVRAFDETKIRTKKASFSYMSAIIETRRQNNQLTGYYNRAADIDRLDKEQTGEGEKK